jgi:uncharacterized protein (DUF2062 family)
MKNRLKNLIPPAKEIQKSHQLKGLKYFLHAPCFWSYDIQCTSRGVAAGLAGAVIPGFQIFYAAILAIILRGNLPIALLCTLITNPLTAVPITYFIYCIGTLIIGNGKKDFVLEEFQWDFSSFHAFWLNVSGWSLQFGKAFLVGLPIVSLCLGILGYFGTIFIWKAYSFFIHKKKKK